MDTIHPDDDEPTKDDDETHGKDPITVKAPFACLKKKETKTL